MGFNHLYYLITSSVGLYQIRITMKTTAIPGINSFFIYYVFFPVPNINEQQAIATYLDTKTARIDRIIKTINTQIANLKELRKTLINDMVTGKKKFRRNFMWKMWKEKQYERTSLTG